MKHLLLLEDDLISREFMAEALRELPIQLHTGSCFKDIRALSLQQHFALVICDLNLADGNLLENYSHLPSGIPVLATSADLSPDTKQSLAAIGFVHILAKPMRIAELVHAVSQLLPELHHESERALWDHEKAERTLGHNPTALANLKLMFAAELEAMQTQIVHAFNAGQHHVIQQQLHKLKASCGFLGAERLLQASHALDHNPSEQALQHFLEVLDATRATM